MLENLMKRLNLEEGEVFTILENTPNGKNIIGEFTFEPCLVYKLQPVNPYNMIPSEEYLVKLLADGVLTVAKKQV